MDTLSNLECPWTLLLRFILTRLLEGALTYGWHEGSVMSVGVHSKVILARVGREYRLFHVVVVLHEILENLVSL